MSRATPTSGGGASYFGSNVRAAWRRVEHAERKPGGALLLKVDVTRNHAFPAGLEATMGPAE